MRLLPLLFLLPFAVIGGTCLNNERKLPPEPKLNRPEFRNWANKILMSKEFTLQVSRNEVYESIQKFSKLSADKYRHTLRIKFMGEDGVDVDGLSREYLHLLASELMSESRNLFTTTPTGSYRISPSSTASSKTYETIGRIMAMAVLNDRNFDIPFVRPYYKLMLGGNLETSDLEWFDEDLYKNLESLSQNSVAGLDLTFSIDTEYSTSIELVEHGESINVTDANKEEFIRLYAESKMRGQVKEQLNALISGFNSVIPADEISMFADPSGLEMLIAGEPRYNVEDWKNNTIVQDYSREDKLIIWFWNYLETLSDLDLSRLLKFITGSPRVLAGARTIFTIAELYGGYETFPTANTCSKQIRIPAYETYELLAERMNQFMKWGVDEGFGLW